MFENRRRGRQARNFTTNVPKILVLKSASGQMFSRKLALGAPDKNAKQLLAKKNFSLTNSLITYPRHIPNRILRKSKDITSKIIRE